MRRIAAVPFRTRVSSTLIVLLLAGPVLLAIWTVPLFVTQDGPAHLYSGHLIARLLSGDKWLGESFVLVRVPLPNLLAQLLLAALTAVLPGRIPDQVLMSLTFVGFAGGILALRRAVRGGERLLLLSPFALMLALGRLWLLGFYGFLLGAVLFCLTLAWWWRVRDDLTAGRVARLAALLLLGWVAHLISFAVTALALAYFAVILPGRRLRRLLQILAASIPSAILAAWYGAMVSSHGSLTPVYLRMKSHSIAQWLQYLRTIKLLSIARQTALPFVGSESALFPLISPATLAGIAFIIWSVTSVRRRDRDGAAWAALSALLLIAGAIAPDSFGGAGGFLRERLFLIGLVCAVPAWRPGSGTGAKVAVALAVVAFVIQSAFVWEYAIRSQRQLAPLIEAAEAIPERSRIYVLPPHLRDQFNARPWLHAASLLGCGREVVVWNHYQSNLYFFPVNFREPFLPCSEDGSCEVARYAPRIDSVVVWGARGRADGIAAASFPVAALVRTEVRVYVRRTDDR